MANIVVYKDDQKNTPKKLSFHPSFALRGVQFDDVLVRGGHFVKLALCSFFLYSSSI